MALAARHRALSLPLGPLGVFCAQTLARTGGERLPADPTAWPGPDSPAEQENGLELARITAPANPSVKMSGERSGVQARRSTVGSPLQLTLDIECVLTIATRQAVRAEFRFDPDTVWAVSARFAVEGGPRVEWRIGRDLLQQRLSSTSGLGSIRMWPSGSEERATAWLQLASGSMAALFELPVPPLAEWLERTYELVPVGTELTELDWNTAAAALLLD